MFRYIYWKSQQRCALKKTEWRKWAESVVRVFPQSDTCYLLLVIYWNQNRKNILKSHKQTFAHHMRVTIKKGKKNKQWLRIKVPQLSKPHSLPPDENSRTSSHTWACTICVALLLLHAHFKSVICRHWLFSYWLEWTTNEPNEQSLIWSYVQYDL